MSQSMVLAVWRLEAGATKAVLQSLVAWQVSYFQEVKAKAIFFL